ncbi:MAG TPA: hypothetical protein VHQ23_07105 [Ilumatobacteraceae bacterium]|nr:hypothetical protein [Ilumatobacteraceae bacterium]
MIHRLAAALALVAIGISLPVATAPAHAARWVNGACTDNLGITIVVDFHELGGGVNVACAPGPVTSGLDALDKAGVLWEGTRRFPGFPCRIAGLPGPDIEPCVNTPPATAYWSYWLAPRGGAWCYSSVGAGNRTPPPGTIEGWSFAFDHASSDIPPPGLDPPAPIPGEAPNPLRGGDCGSPAATPTPPPATPAPTVPPPNAPAPTAAPTTAAVFVDPDSANTAVDAPPQQAAAGPLPSTTVFRPGANEAAVTTTSVASAIATSTSASTTTRAPTESTQTTDGSGPTSSGDTSSPTDDSVPLGTVDLSDDGRGDGEFSPAAGLGLLVAAGVGGTSVWAARRRQRGSPP